MSLWDAQRVRCPVNCKFITALLIALLTNSCAAMDVAKEVQSGRLALQRDDPRAAIPHFEAAARMNPDYITDFTLADIGVWTYLGRAYLEAGESEEAFEALKKATARGGKDHFGRIYLGLLQVEQGSVEVGRRELEAGLKGLGTWLKKVPGYGMEGQYWDPGNLMAKKVIELLSLLPAEPIDRQGVRKGVLWLGANFDEEIDEVKRQEGLERDDDGRPKGRGR